MKPSSIHVADLVGFPYRAGGTDPAQGVDCLWVARQAALRVFPDMPHEHFPIDRIEAEAARGEECWRKVGCAGKLGDILLGNSPEPWVAILVDAAGRYCLTANRKRGTYLTFIGNMSQPDLVLRYKRKAAP